MKSSPGSNMRPPAMAGEESDEVEALVSILFEEARGCLSICGCWSTGKKLQSFFNRIHMAHRSWASSGARKHLILRRRQCPVNLSQCVSHMHVAMATHRRLSMCDGTPICFSSSRPSSCQHLRAHWVSMQSASKRLSPFFAVAAIAWLPR